MSAVALLLFIPDGMFMPADREVHGCQEFTKQLGLSVFWLSLV